MTQNRWIFEAGRRVPRWLVETVDCTAIFNWPALVIERDDRWEIHPIEPVPAGSSPFLLRPATERHHGAASPTRPICHSYEVRASEGQRTLP
jgi:hypothetical protein